MNCLIFCLLTFCAPKIVFADDIEQELQNLRDQFLKQFHKMMERLNSGIPEAINDLMQKGATPNIYSCRIYFDEFWGTILENAEYQECMACHDKAAKKRNTKMPKKCCINNMTALEKEAKIKRAQVTACIAKFVHEAQAAGVKGPPKKTRKGPQEETWPQGEESTSAGHSPYWN